jgi:hypothetical protein
MKLQSHNFSQIEGGHFYKATTGGVQKCHIVDNLSSQESGFIGDPVWGFVVDSMFVALNKTTDFFHFDVPTSGFFTTEQEATDFHRRLVINYINGLNASSLKTNPIIIWDPTEAVDAEGNAE